MLSGNVNIVVLLKSMHWIRWFSFAIIHGQIVFQRRPLKLTLFLLVFLAVQTRVWESSIPTPVTEWVQTDKGFYFLTYRVTLEPCDLWDIWSEWWGHMIWPKRKTMTKTNTKTKTITKTNTFRELHQRAILETCDLWDIWSEWWGDMTLPTKRQW